MVCARDKGEEKLKKKIRRWGRDPNKNNRVKGERNKRGESFGNGYTNSKLHLLMPEREPKKKKKQKFPAPLKKGGKNELSKRKKSTER